MKLIARIYFWLIGWKWVKTIPPSAKKFVIVAAPHTSNWDFPIAMGALYLMDIKVNYLAKRELFKFPMGILFKAMGGIPVDRSRAGGMVDRMIEEFSKHRELVLLVPPEGSRSQVKQWKTGFYRVAAGANVPIALGYLDYGKKEAGVTQLFYPTGDLEKDMAEIKTFYRGITPKYPEKFTI
jgi:1-acyl-sn-glycerol-3-phosphate acyltransferase